MSRKKSLHKPPQSYSDFMSKDVLRKIEQNVDARIIQVSQMVARQQSGLLQSVFLRIAAMEELLCDKLGVSKDAMSNMVAKKQDDAEGYTEKDVVELGDRVRITLSSKAPADSDFSDASKFMIDELGVTDFTKEVNEALPGLKVGKDVVVTLESGDQLKIVVDRISKKPVEEKVEQDVNA